MTGREHELGLLLELWDQARQGRGQVVRISGEPGIGKSRLLHTLREGVASQQQRWLVCRCQAHTQSSALFPVIQLIEQEIGLEATDTPAQRLEKLERSLETSGQSSGESRALLASLLSLSLSPPAAVARLERSPESRKRGTMEALLGWLLALAAQQPLVVVAEDLHWADPSSIEFLQSLLKRVDGARILLLLTHRPELALALPARRNVREFRLARLDREEVTRIVDALAAGRRLPAEVVEQVVARTDGVPLFVEELVRTILESDLLVENDGALELRTPLPTLAIPATLNDSVTARLERLSPAAREIAQLAAVIGRDFSGPLLGTLCDEDDDGVRETLHRLVLAGLLEQRGEAAYSFRHVLVREIAYQSVPDSRRRLLHRQVADILADRARDTVQSHPEFLAHHYAAAGMAERAFDYWIQAGDRAAQRSAFREAIVHLRCGLEMLASMPESIETQRYELQAQVMLGDALIAVMGYGAPEVGSAYNRARELCQLLGEEPQLGFVLGGVWVYFLIRAEYRTALEVAEQLLRLSKSMPIPLLAAGAHTALGSTLMNLGGLVAARQHLEKAVAHGDRDQLVLASDMRVSGLCFLANVLAALGELDEARRRTDQAVERARSLGKPFFLANALTQSAWIHQLAGNVDAAERTADEAVALSTEQGFPYWQTFCLMTQGWVLAERGRPWEGLAQMLRSETVAAASGTERGTTARLATLAEGYQRVGRVDDALATLDRAFEHVERTGERFCEAELHRLRGEALAQRDGALTAAAESCLRDAIELARFQQAGLWERRAEGSLARLSDKA